MLNYIIKFENKDEKLVIISLSGDLDSKIALDFYEYIIKLESIYSRLILDCEGLNSISSFGISILLRIRKRFIHNNIISVIAGLNDETLDLFMFFGFNKLFYITKNIASAKNILNTLHPVEKEKIELNEIGIINHPIPKKINRVEEIQVFYEEISTEPDLPILSSDEVKEEYAPLFLSEAKYPAVENDTEAENITLSSTLEEPSKDKKNYEFTIPFITKGNSNEVDIKESIIIEEESREYDSKFTELVINCGNCGTRIKIKKQGKQKCPTCHASFLLRQSGSISTIEKL
jgi:anti-sigma B factor antagonist